MLDIGELSRVDVAQSYHVVGRGTVTLQFVPFEGDATLWRTDRAHFEFANATATPEPTSVILLGSGLAGLVYHVPRKRTPIP